MASIIYWFIYVASLYMTSCLGYNSNNFHLTILHTSDVTASFEQFNSAGENCSEQEERNDECLGGVARRGSVIEEVRNEQGHDGTDLNVLLLDGGDQFVGEWFNVYKGNATSHFMNKLGYDAMTFGNLEFTLGPDGLAPFLEDINFNAVSANLDVSEEPVLQGLFNKSVVKMVGGERIGIVGYTVQRANNIALVGNARFEDVITSVQQEVDALTSIGINKIIVIGHSYGLVRDGVCVYVYPACRVRNARFEDVITSVQQEVDALTSIGINKIIVIGHSYGLVRDENEALEIAHNVPGVDVIILGGALLFQCNDCSHKAEDKEAIYRTEPYPMKITPKHNPDDKVLLVHGYIDGRYIGRLNVVFDEEGKLLEWDGNPIRLDGNIKQDPDLLKEINEYAEHVDNTMNKVIGRTVVKLQGGPRGHVICRQTECNMGNLITDAMIWKYTSSLDNTKWNNVSLAVMNGGGIRASIEEGDIRLADLGDVLPFRNTFDAVEIEGKYIREMLEHAAAGYDKYSGAFLQVSGLRVTYDLTSAPYHRVIDVLQCIDCINGAYYPLEEHQVYKIALSSFIRSGGDGYEMIKNNTLDYVVGEPGKDVVASYIEHFSPLSTSLDGRIVIHGSISGNRPRTMDIIAYVSVSVGIVLLLAVVMLVYKVYGLKLKNREYLELENQQK
ncbi:snake venom 5'-nucleotidase-like [Amphiura filiformis]|uniref:snake venom 5'-nucleotidase-like n=1 Tax=Amphiura filiformis TaxID=82378 RepID=UPI003B216469